MVKRENASEAACAAIVRLLGDIEELGTGRWVLLAESLGTDGERGVWQIAPPGQKNYETLGLLKAAEHRELVATLRDELQGD